MNKCKFTLQCFLILSTYFVTITVAREGIINGPEARLHQFPHQVSVQVIGYGHMCGGGIIDSYFVLTAAHCVTNDSGQIRNFRMAVVAGINNLYKNYEKDKYALSVEVAKIFITKEYKLHVHPTADIAILKLKDSLKLSNRIYLKRLELPKNKNETYAGKAPKLAGFGWNWIKLDEKFEEYGNNSDGHLRFVRTQVRSHRKCHAEHLLSKTDSEKLICAHVQQLDVSKPMAPCNADSGSPLVLGNTVIAILSQTPFMCTEKQASSWYTSVSHYMPFIYNVIKNKNMNGIDTLSLGDSCLVC